MPLNPSRRPILAVVWDAVGTLLYPEPSVAEAYQRAGQRHGFSLTEPCIQQRFGLAYQRHFDRQTTDEAAERRAWQAVVAEVFESTGEAGEALFCDLWSHFADPQSWRVFEDVVPAWERLRRQGLQLAIASNFDERLVEICQQLVPLSGADHVFCSSQIGFSKPQPAFFRAVQRALKRDANEILLVGDDPHCDYKGAITAGWQATLVDREGRHAHPAAITALDQLQ